MKFILLSLLLIFTSSCDSNNSEVKELKGKIARLENRIDSLIASLTTPQQIRSGQNYNIENGTIYTTPAIKTKKQSGYSSQCLAITKKGYRCSRKARSGGYCWQHGG